MAASESWSDPYHCPFCGAALASPGSGFVDHLENSTDCESSFDAWRDRIGGDMAGGWSG